MRPKLWMCLIHLNDLAGSLDQGFRAIARPTLGDESVAFESYSADKVTIDFGLHSRW